MSMTFDAYMRDVVQPMRDELTRLGVKELRTPEEVTEALDIAEGTAMVVVNSVCGCAAGNARPAVAAALQHSKVPDRLYTVFAGQDKEATAKAREYFAPYPPSSPSIAILKDGKLVQLIERHRIEDRTAGEIAADLKDAFDQFCG
ncbi:BrxA/BrxB family bacilliredoxin [Paenibacillus sp. YN15]|uniref:BrxA/BrxB family bacilliredoxin n=1 Tax=Paenibacillus sp. YN15 TaxID=1742774 RepID=UPI000DCC00C7|nr:BrxA/BrxB family bacilliredoxin [Paenibacillus sp. YN15]RAU92351.1 BrxA/BrxB family bacilliredoxin [Paenibacillus sp. YN15]